MSSPVVSAYNKIFLSFLKDLRKASPKFSSILSKKYPTFDMMSDDHFQDFKGFAEEVVSRVTNDDGFSFKSIEAAREVVKGITLEQLYTVDGIDNEIDVYILTLLAIWKSEEVENSLFILLSKLKAIEEGTDPDEAGEIFDESLNMFVCLIQAKKTAEEDDGVADDLMERLVNSKIGKLAQDISKSLPMDNIKDPKDLFSMNNIGNLGKMMQHVSETLNSKIKDGELNHQDIMAEAFDMMKVIDKSGSLFKNLNMSAFENESKKSKMKQRMRQKLAARKN